MVRLILLAAGVFLIAGISQRAHADVNILNIWRLTDVEADVDGDIELFGATGPSVHGDWNETTIASVDLGDDFAYARATHESSVFDTSYSATLESFSQAQRSLADESYAAADNEFIILFELDSRTRYSIDGWLEATTIDGVVAESYLRLAQVPTGTEIFRDTIQDGSTTFSQNGVLPRGTYRLEFRVLAITAPLSADVLGESTASGYFKFAIPSPGAFALLLPLLIARNRRRRNSTLESRR